MLPVNPLTVLIIQEDIESEMDHSQADRPEYCIADRTNGIAFAQTCFENVSTFVADETIVVLRIEGLTFL